MTNDQGPTAMSEQEDIASVAGSETSGTSLNSKPRVQEEETAIAKEETKNVVGKIVHKKPLTKK